MEKQSLTSEQSLELISNMITRAKDNFRGNNFLFLLWGWLLLTACTGRFLLEMLTGTKYAYAPFPALAAIGIIVTLVYFNKRSKSVETYLNYFFRTLWTVLTAGFLMVVFVSVYQKADPTVYILIMEGIGTAVSGMVMKFTPLTLGGVIFFLAAVCALFVPDEYKNLVHGVAITIGYLVPGYLLKNLDE